MPTGGRCRAWMSFGIPACKILLGRGDKESDRFADARIWLAFGRRMPWRIMIFLTDARQRGVLRQSGTVYQFRHACLQDQFADQYPRLSRCLASAAVCGIRGYKGPLWGLARTWSPKSTAPWSQPFRAVRFQEFARQALGDAAPQVERAGRGLSMDRASPAIRRAPASLDEPPRALWFLFGRSAAILPYAVRRCAHFHRDMFQFA